MRQTALLLSSSRFKRRDERCSPPVSLPPAVQIVSLREATDCYSMRFFYSGGREGFFGWGNDSLVLFLLFSSSVPKSALQCRRSLRGLNDKGNLTVRLMRHTWATSEKADRPPT